MCIAGADLAHIGIKFGHARPADEAFRRECEEKDRLSLEAVVKGEGEGFFQAIAAERDERNICGLPCTYAMLRVLEGRGARGELLSYGQAPDPVPGTIVSFAAAALYG